MTVPTTQNSPRPRVGVKPPPMGAVGGCSSRGLEREWLVKDRARTTWELQGQTGVAGQCVTAKVQS